MQKNRRNVLGIALAILCILLVLLLGRGLGKDVYDFKVDNTEIAFLLIFPQLFVGLSLYRFKFILYFKFFQPYHRIFGYVLIGIYLIVSFLVSTCIYLH